MFQTPYYRRILDDESAQQGFISAFVKMHENQSERFGLFISRLISRHKMLTTEVSELNVLAQTARGLEQQSMTSQIIDKSNEVAHLACLFDSIKMRLEEDSHMGFAYAIIRLDYDQVLGTVRNLGRLRSFLEEIEPFSDDGEIKDYMETRYDIERCNDCGEYEYTVKTCDTYGGDSVCRECANDNYRYSQRYGEYIYADDARDARDQNGDLCVIHYDDSDFHYDEDEDEYIHCDYEREPQLVGGYHSSKRRQVVIKDDWSNKRNRWLGVELECEIKSDQTSREEKACFLNDLINDGEIGNKVFFETDGSLNYGIEIVSQPMSLPMHQDLWQWLNNKDAVRHMRSHNTTTCGLHVHVSRNPLTQDQIAKMVVFVNDRSNEALIKAVARRYAEGYCRIKEKEIGSAHQSNDRYEAINITSERTIEFRIFKGSLKYESVMSAIEFANALTDFTASPVLGVKDLTTDRFMDFINSGQTEASVLVPYLNNRLELA
jgi:hypothetical protein